MGYYRELLENEEELNQLAKEALKKAGKTPKPMSLYCLQLVKWALENGEVNALNNHLLLFLDLLQGWEPAAVMNFLGRIPDEELLLMAECKDWEPVDLACKILDDMDSAMNEKMEEYATTNP